MKRTHYDALGIRTGASHGEIRSAYRRLVRRYHPDSDPDLDPEEATSRLDEVVDAWKVLRDPDSRADYDMELGLDRETWHPPPVPYGFTLFPKRGILFTRQGAEDYHRTADHFHRALSLQADGPDLSGLQEIPDQLWRLKANSPRLDDAQLVHLAAMGSMHWLDLSGTAITDHGLHHLTRLPDLNHLELWGTGVTDAGMRTIADITSLEYLSLGDTAVSDAGLIHLATLSDLDTLDLRGTHVRGPGLVHLYGIGDLDDVRLPWRVRPRHRRALQDALPHVRLH